MIKGTHNNLPCIMWRDQKHLKWIPGYLYKTEIERDYALVILDSLPNNTDITDFNNSIQEVEARLFPDIKKCNDPTFFDCNFFHIKNCKKCPVYF